MVFIVRICMEGFHNCVLVIQVIIIAWTRNELCIRVLFDIEIVLRVGKKNLIIINHVNTTDDPIVKMHVGSVAYTIKN